MQPTAEVQAFLTATLPKAEWTHAAHLRVGAWHVLAEGDGALEHMRTRIRQLNDAHGTPNTNSSGYHETLTVLYLHLIRQWLGQQPNFQYPAQLADLVSDLGARELPLQYYSRERLFTPEARAAFVAPDVKPLP